MVPTLRLRREHCTRYRFRYSACERCLDACPHDAVRLTEEGVEIDGGRCRNCGLCAAACQTEAIVATNIPRNTLHAAADGRTDVAIACRPSGEPGDVMVPCLGAIDPVTLAHLGRRGVKVELRGTAHCDGCEHGARGAECLRVALEGVERLREASANEGWPRPVVTRPSDSGDGSRDGGSAMSGRAASRRHLFRRFLGRGVDAVADAAQPVLEPAPLRAIRIEAPVSVERRELLRGIWPAEADVESVIEAHESLPLGRVRVDRARCSACEACARACPTAAIEVVESSLGWALTFRASRCVACAVCVEVCQADALAMAGPLPAAAMAAKVPEVLQAVPKKRCSRCDRSFLAGNDAEQCPTCQGDDEDFAALFG